MTGQNTSSAVMQQRAKAADSLDYYPSPPWVARALCEFLEADGFKARAGRGHDLTCWEPAFGSGDLARGLSDYFDGMICSDIHAHDRIAVGQRPPVIGDFLIDALWREEDGPLQADWIITNPPFKLGAQFVETALHRARRGVAMFVRSAFLEGQDRYKRLYSVTPPALVLQFCERVPLFKGKLRAPEQSYWDATSGGGQWRKPSTATSYSWIVWAKGYNGRPAMDWIAPDRRRFERAGDYPPADQPPEAAGGDLLQNGPHSAECAPDGGMPHE